MQEQKNSAELDKALTEYAELKEQTANFDSLELYEARQAIRPAQEKAAEAQLEETSQKKQSLHMLLSAKQEASRLIGEIQSERYVMMQYRARSSRNIRKSERSER